MEPEGSTRPTIIIGKTISFSNLIEEIMDSLQVESHVTPEMKVQKKGQMVAKFKEEDGVVAFSTFLQETGRRPLFFEFCEFINRMEGMPSRRKSFEELITENIGYREEITAIKDQNRDLREQVTRLQNQSGQNLI